jgi:predicted nucleotidyltransferase
MAEQIDVLARAEGRTRSEMIREMVRAYAGRRGGAAALAAETPAEYMATLAPETPTAALPFSPTEFESLRRSCSVAGVFTLWAFGSATRSDFDPAKSDFDLLVEFIPSAPARTDLAAFLDLEEQFAIILGRKVELVQRSAVRSRRLLKVIDDERVLVYGSA